MFLIITETGQPSRKAILTDQSLTSYLSASLIYFHCHTKKSKNVNVHYSLGHELDNINWIVGDSSPSPIDKVFSCKLKAVPDFCCDSLLGNHVYKHTYFSLFRHRKILATGNSLQIEIFSSILDIVNAMLQLVCSTNKYEILRKLSARCTIGVKKLNLTKSFRKFCALVTSEKIFKL